MTDPNTTTDIVRPMPQADTAAFSFYDVESLENIFSVCVYYSTDHHVDVFYLLDNPKAVAAPTHDALLDAITQANPAWIARAHDAGFAPYINVYDLAQPGNTDTLATALGGITSAQLVHDLESENINEAISEDLRPICDTFYAGLVPPDMIWDPTVHPFIVGYNSFNYDTTMLAIYFALAYSDQECTARILRHHNDNLFSSEIRDYMPGYFYKHDEGRTISRFEGTNIAHQIRTNMISSGRHLDIARLNEIQRMVGLKRLLGMEGHQILESDKLSSDTKITDTEEFLELIAYNVSDVVGTAMLFENKVYTGAFNLRAGLINTYPEVMFEHTGDFATPNIHPLSIKRKRLTYDSFSAQFAGTILAPYRALHEIPGHQADRPTVSFLYPDPDVAEEMGVIPTNVLEDARDFFYEHVPDTTQSAREARAAFDNVYNYYRSIEGKNFNTAVHRDVHEVAEMLARHLEWLLKQYTEYAQNSQDATITHNVEVAYPQLIEQYKAVFPTRMSQIEREKQGLGPVTTPIDDVMALQAPIVAMLETIGKTLYATYHDTHSHKANYLEALASVAYVFGFAENITHTAGVTHAQRANHDDNDYMLTWPVPDYSHVYSLNEIQKLPNNIPYYFVDDEGNAYDTGCFVTFSTGGIHGAEYNADLYAATHGAYVRAMARMTAIIDQALVDMTEPDAALDRLLDAEGRNKPTATHTKKFTQAQDGLDAWVDTVMADEELLAKVPDITPMLPDGTQAEYSWEKDDLIRAAWWIRKVMKIVFVDPNTGASDVAEHKEVIAAGKAAAPFLRAKPSKVTDVALFEQDSSPQATHNGKPHSSTKLKDTFVYTSVGEMVHEDFASYYPLMLTNMAAFANPDLAKAGSNPDRYRDIFGQKETFGKMMKDKDTYSADERAYFAVQREGVKLILNSASGAADAGHNTPILMNNTVISMRLIGQILTWTVAQAQSFIGGRAPSTNTDGVYMEIDFDKGAEVLHRLEPIINVQIEPESLMLVSKDSNNRIEFDTPDTELDNPLDLQVAAVGGGTLAAYFGPNPRKSLAHPAVEDRILGDYFKLIAAGNYYPVNEDGTTADTPLSIDQPMHRETVRMLLARMEEELGIAESLRFYQNLLASSPSKNTYLFAARGVDDATWVPNPNNPDEKVDTQNYTLLGHYSRVFMIESDDAARKAGFDPARIGAAKMRKVNDKDLAKRRKDQGLDDNAFPQNRFDVAAQHLYAQADVDINMLMRGTHDIGIYKHSGVDPAQPSVVVNRTLKHSTDPAADKALFDILDREAYIDSIIATYEKNWQNPAVDPEHQHDAIDFTALTPLNAEPVSRAQADRIAHRDAHDEQGATTPVTPAAPATPEAADTTPQGDDAGNTAQASVDQPAATPTAYIPASTIGVPQPQPGQSEFASHADSPFGDIHPHIATSVPQVDMPAPATHTPPAPAVPSAPSVHTYTVPASTIRKPEKLRNVHSDNMQNAGAANAQRTGHSTTVFDAATYYKDDPRTPMSVSQYLAHITATQSDTDAQSNTGPQPNTAKGLSVAEYMAMYHPPRTHGSPDGNDA